MLDPNKNRMEAVFGRSQRVIKRPISVNFRIDERTWSDFNEYAAMQGTDRSKLINKFIEECLLKSHC